MTPTITQIYQDAYVPYEAGEIKEEEALTAAIGPIRQFMYGETQTKDVELLWELRDWTGTGSWMTFR